MVRNDSDRRGFLARIGGWAAGGLALWFVPGCDGGLGGTGAAGSGDACAGRMHGPVEVDYELLQLPLAEDAVPLFAPYAHGELFARGWAIAHITREERGQLVLAIVDVETGGHAQLELWARDPAMDPVAHSARFGVYVNNRGSGDTYTPRHIRSLATRLAEIVRANEDRVTLDPALPRLADAPTREELRERREAFELRRPGQDRPQAPPRPDRVGEELPGASDILAPAPEPAVAPAP